MMSSKTFTFIQRVGLAVLATLALVAGSAEMASATTVSPTAASVATTTTTAANGGCKATATAMSFNGLIHGSGVVMCARHLIISFYRITTTIKRFGTGRVLNTWNTGGSYPGSNIMHAPTLEARGAGAFTVTVSGVMFINTNQQCNVPIEVSTSSRTVTLG